MKCCVLLTTLFIAVLFSSVVSYYVDSLGARNEVTERGVEQYKKDDVTEDREKRYVHIFFNVVFLGLSVANAGLTVAAMLTDGCAVNKDICKYKKQIEDSENLMNTLNARFETLYNSNRWEYLYIQEAMNDNEYIQRSIDEAMREVENEAEIAQIINLRLSLTLQTMEQMYSNTSNSTEALDNIIKPLSFAFDDIQKMLHSEKTKSLITFAAFKIGSVAFEYTYEYLNKAMNKFTSHVKKHSYKYDLMDVICSEPKKNPVTQTDKMKAFLNDKIFSNKHFVRVKNSFRYMYDKVLDFKDKATVDNLKKATKRVWKNKGKIWTSIKTGFRSIFNSVKSSALKIKKFVSKPAESFNKYKETNFKFKPSKALSSFISMGFAALETAMILNQWKQVADQLKEVAEEYEKYNDELKLAIQEAEEEEITIGGYWDNVTESFQVTIAAFNEVIEDVNSNNGSYFEMYGLNSTDIDTSHAFFHTDFETTNRTLIFEHQKLARDYLEYSGNTLQSLTYKFRARETLFNITDIYMADGKEIKTIHELLKQIFNSKNNEIEKAFGRDLTVSNVVCIAAMLYPEEEEYDFYNLTRFLETMCEISDSEFDKMDNEAKQNRMSKILKYIVNRDVPKSKSVEEIYNAVQGAYELNDDEDTRDFGLSLKKRDIVCEISQSFPDLSTYKTYPLDRFRPTCSDVSDNEFEKMDAEAKKYTEFKNYLDMMMPMCIANPLPYTCQCPDVYVAISGLDKATVTEMINEYKPKPNCVYKDTDPCQWDCPA